MQHSLIGQGNAMKIPLPPRDLADFHLRWSEFRPAMVTLQLKPDLAADEAAILGWLIALSDRISAVDLGQ